MNTNVDGDLYFTNGSAHKTGTSRNLTPSSVLHKRDLDTPLKHEPPTKKLKPDYKANMMAVDANIDGEHLCSTNGNHHKAELRSCDSTSIDPDIDLTYGTVDFDITSCGTFANAHGLDSFPIPIFVLVLINLISFQILLKISVLKILMIMLCLN